MSHKDKIKLLLVRLDSRLPQGICENFGEKEVARLSDAIMADESLMYFERAKLCRELTDGLDALMSKHFAAIR
jgi:hypothetical protein